MKTVPSGKLLVCKYGAPAVGGTDGATILKPPVSVGKPMVGGAAVSLDPPVITGMLPVVAAPPPSPVITGML